MGDEAPHVVDLVGAEAPAQGAAGEDRFDSGLGDDERLGAPLGDAPLAGDRAIVPGQSDAENKDREQPQDPVQRETASERARRSRGGLHALSIGPALASLEQPTLGLARPARSRDEAPAHSTGWCAMAGG